MLFMKGERWSCALIQIKTHLGFTALWILKCEPLSNGSKLIFTLVSDISSNVLKMSVFGRYYSSREKIQYFP